MDLVSEGMRAVGERKRMKRLEGGGGGRLIRATPEGNS